MCTPTYESEGASLELEPDLLETIYRACLQLNVHHSVLEIKDAQGNMVVMSVAD